MAQCCVTRCVDVDTHARGVTPGETYQTSWSMWVPETAARHTVDQPASGDDPISTRVLTPDEALILVSVQVGRVTARGPQQGMLAFRIYYTDASSVDLHAVTPRGLGVKTLVWRAGAPARQDYFWYVATPVGLNQWLLSPYETPASAYVSRDAATTNLTHNNSASSQNTGTMAIMTFGVARDSNYTVHEPVDSSINLATGEWPFAQQSTFPDQGFVWNQELYRPVQLSTSPSGVVQVDDPARVVRQYMGVIPSRQASEVFASDWVREASSSSNTQTGYFLRWLQFARQSQNYQLYENPNTRMLYGSKTDRAGFGNSAWKTSSTDGKTFPPTMQSNLFAVSPFNVPRAPFITGGTPYSGADTAKIGMLTNSLPGAAGLTAAPNQPLGWYYGALVAQNGMPFDDTTDTWQDFLASLDPALPLAFAQRSGAAGTYYAYFVDFTAASPLIGQLGLVQVGNNKGAQPQKPFDSSVPNNPALPALTTFALTSSAASDDYFIRLYSIIADTGGGYQLKSSAQLIPYLQIASGSFRTRLRVPSRATVLGSDPTDPFTPPSTTAAQLIQANLQALYAGAASTFNSVSGGQYAQFQPYYNFAFTGGSTSTTVNPSPMPGLVFAIWSYSTNEVDLDQQRVDTHCTADDATCPTAQVAADRYVITNNSDWIGKELQLALTLTATTLSGTAALSDGSAPAQALKPISPVQVGKVYTLTNATGTLFGETHGLPKIVVMSLPSGAGASVDFAYTVYAYAQSFIITGDVMVGAVSRKGARPVASQLVRGGPLDATAQFPVLHSNQLGGPGYLPFSAGGQGFDLPSNIGADATGTWVGGVGAVVDDTQVPLASISPWVVPNQASTRPAGCPGNTNVLPSYAAGSETFDSSKTAPWWSAGGAPAGFTDEVRENVLFHVPSSASSASTTRATTAPCQLSNALGATYVTAQTATTPPQTVIVDDDPMVERPGLNTINMPQYTKQEVNSEIDFEIPSNAPDLVRLPVDITDPRYLTRIDVVATPPGTTPGQVAPNTGPQFHSFTCPGMSLTQRVCAGSGQIGTPAFMSVGTATTATTQGFQLMLWADSPSLLPLPTDDASKFLNKQVPGIHVGVTPLAKSATPSDPICSGGSTPTTEWSYTIQDVQWAAFNPEGMYVQYAVTGDGADLGTWIRSAPATYAFGSGTSGQTMTITFTMHRLTAAFDPSSASPPATESATAVLTYFDVDGNTPDTGVCFKFQNDAQWNNYFVNTAAHGGAQAYVTAGTFGGSSYSELTVDTSLIVAYVDRAQTMNINAYRWTNGDGTGTYNNCYLEDRKPPTATSFSQPIPWIGDDAFHDLTAVWYTGGQRHPTSIADGQSPNPTDHPRVDFYQDDVHIGTLDAMVPAFAGRLWMTMWQSATAGWAGTQLATEPTYVLSSTQTARVQAGQEAYFTFWDVSEVEVAPQYDISGAASKLLPSTSGGVMKFTYTDGPNLPLRDTILPNGFDQPSIELGPPNAQPVATTRTKYWTGAGSDPSDFVDLPGTGRLTDMTAYAPYYSFPAGFDVTTLIAPAFRFGWANPGYTVLTNPGGAMYNGAPVFDDATPTTLFLQNAAQQVFAFENFPDGSYQPYWTPGDNCTAASDPCNNAPDSWWTDVTTHLQGKVFEVPQQYSAIANTATPTIPDLMNGFLFKAPADGTPNVTALVYPYAPSSQTPSATYYLVVVPPAGDTWTLATSSITYAAYIDDGGGAVDVFSRAAVQLLVVAADPTPSTVQPNPPAGQATCAFSGPITVADLKNGPLGPQRLTEHCDQVAFVWYPPSATDLAPGTTCPSCYFQTSKQTGGADVDVPLRFDVAGAIGGPWAIAVNGTTASTPTYVAVDEYGVATLSTKVTEPTWSTPTGAAVSGANPEPPTRYALYRVLTDNTVAGTASHLASALTAGAASTGNEYGGWVFSPAVPMAVKTVGRYFVDSGGLPANATVEFVLFDVLDNRPLNATAMSVAASAGATSVSVIVPSAYTPPVAGGDMQFAVRLVPGRTYFLATNGIAGVKWATLPPTNLATPQFNLPLSACGHGVAAGSTMPSTLTFNPLESWCTVGEWRAANAVQYANVFLTAEVLLTRDTCVQLTADTLIDVRADLMQTNALGWVGHVTSP